MQKEQRDIRAALCKRGNTKRRDVEPIEQIGAEAPCDNLLFEVDFAGRDEAHVERHDFVRSEPGDDAFLEDAQEFSLKVEWHRADLVEQDGTTATMLELAIARADGTGKGAGLMAEKLARSGFPAVPHS